MMRAAGRKGKMRAGRPSESPDHAAHGSARARVYYALFTLLRLLTLHCTRKRSVAEGEKAHQTEKGAVDDPTRSPADPGDFLVRKAHRRSESVAAADELPGAVATGITSVTAANAAQVVGPEGLTPEALGALERGPGLGA